MTPETAAFRALYLHTIVLVRLRSRRSCFEKHRHSHNQLFQENSEDVCTIGDDLLQSREALLAKKADDDVDASEVNPSHFNMFGS